ncbi:hypothetical protein MBLNU230_g0912t1 [Neophaeotheca triangularis]
MSASSIPNLNTLRSGPGRTRSRGARRGWPPGRGDEQSAQDAASSKDKIVQQTDNDALSSRLSAASLGYFANRDPYTTDLSVSGEPIIRRYPIINLGTYVRTAAIDKLVDRFIEAEPRGRKQIVSLGAGSDTRFWRLAADKPDVNIIYHELDFASNVKQKQDAIARSDRLRHGIDHAKQRCATYDLRSLDLRDLASDAPPEISDLESDTPTLLLSECCLCYLPPDTATKVLQYFSRRISSPLGLVLYEPIRPFDPFGQTMITNLGSRGIHMQTLKRYSSLAAQRQRLRQAGFVNGQGARDVWQIWEDRAWVSQEERERVEKLEWIDEIEEWKLLGSHYCVAWGWRGDTFTNAWDGVEGGMTSEEARQDDLD